MKSAPAIAFDYRPSRWLAAAIVLIMLLVIVAIAASGTPLWLKPVLACSACAYGVYALRAFLRGPMRHALWYEAGHWRLADHRGNEQVAELQSGIVRGAWIVLRLRRSDSAHVAIILGPDNSDADTRRRLRVRLARGAADPT